MSKTNLGKITEIVQPELSMYEITLRALYVQSLMDYNEFDSKMICEKCMVFWENYYDYLSKYFDVIIPNWILQNVAQ